VKKQKIFSKIYFWTSEKLAVETQKIQDRFRISLADPTYVITFDEVMKNILTAQNIHTEQFESYKSLRQEKALKTIDRLQSTQKACHHAFSYVGDISTIRDAVQLLSRNKFHETFQAINDHFIINLMISKIARFEHEARAYTLQIGQDVQYHIENLREANPALDDGAIGT
jgi:hypothetical protein